MLTRRGFLIGAGAVVTGAFVKKATAFSRTTGEPLILPHGKRPAETIYIYEQDCEGWRDYEYEEAPYYRCGKWRVSLGPNQPLAPPPPIWREHLRSLGHRLDTVADVKRVLAEESLTPEELDSPLDGFGWEDMWDNFNGPQAKAYHLLKGLDLGSHDTELRQAGEVIFEGSGGAPGNTYTWVELKDDLTASLLQARLYRAGPADQCEGRRPPRALCLMRVKGEGRRWSPCDRMETVASHSLQSGERGCFGRIDALTSRTSLPF